MKRTSALNRLLEEMVPAAIRNTPGVRAEKLVRAKAMVAILALSMILPLVLLAIYLILQVTTDNNFTKNIYLLIGAEVWLVSQHVYFQSYGKLGVTAGAYSVQYLLIVITMVLISGGWASPLLILIFCAPMIAFMTMNYRAALIHVVLVLAVAILLLVIQIKHIQSLPDIQEPANYPYTQFVAWSMALIVLTSFIATLEHLVRSERR